MVNEMNKLEDLQFYLPRLHTEYAFYDTDEEKKTTFEYLKLWSQIVCKNKKVKIIKQTFTDKDKRNQDNSPLNDRSYCVLTIEVEDIDESK